MAQPSVADHIGFIKDAEDCFRLMIAIRLASSSGTLPLEVPDVSVFGQIKVHRPELELDRDAADRAASVMEHTITLSLCLVLAQAIKDVAPNLRRGTDPEKAAAHEIVRLLRNAYAHQPLAPKWNIDPECRNKVYEIASVFRLDTTPLDGAQVRWQDYGGHLALLRLASWIRRGVLNDPDDSSRAVARRSLLPPSEQRVIQYGRLIVRKIDKVPPGVTPIRVNRKPFVLAEPDRDPEGAGRSAGADEGPRS